MKWFICRWCGNKDIDSMSLVSSNPRFSDAGRCVEEPPQSTSMVSINDRNQPWLKKKIKFNDSYFLNLHDSMNDATQDSIEYEPKMSKHNTYQCSPYLKSMIIRENVRKVYWIGKRIGSGQFGSVRIASPYKNPKQRFAIKSVPREAKEDYIKQLEKEFRILKEVDHPNIIKFYESYQDQKYFHFVVEYWEGGELYDLISKKGRLDEDEAAKIIRKLWSTVAHLHDRDIWHRDLKPENILFDSKRPDAEIKLIDFGLSTYARKGREMKTKVGTPFYVAPEVLNGWYHKSWDMWSIGVITYVLLWGYPPFFGDSNEEIFQKITSADYGYPPEDWDFISENAKDFINKLLTLDADKRMTSYEALNHCWFDNSVGKISLHLDVISKLKNFKCKNRLQLEILLIISNLIKNKDTKKVRESFEVINSSFSGWIGLNELYDALKDVMEEKEIEDLMNNIDFDNNGEIRYSEFLAATLNHKYFESSEIMQTIFNYLDTKNEGVLTAEGLWKAFQRSSRWYSLRQLKDMLLELTGKHKVNFKEFCAIFI